MSMDEEYLIIPMTMKHVELVIPYELEMFNDTWSVGKYEEFLTNPKFIFHVMLHLDKPIAWSGIELMSDIVFARTLGVIPSYQNRGKGVKK